MDAVPMFAGLDDRRMTALRARAGVRHLDAGATVARRSEPARHLIVVEDGTLVATRDTAHGRRLRLGEHRGPCAVDKAAVLDGGGYTATWVAATPARVRLLPAVEFRRLLDEVPAVRRHVLRHLAAQVRQRQDGLVEAQSTGAAARIAGWLARQPGDLVPLPSQEQLGEALGASRVTVNRVLRRLHTDGVIRLERGRVVVLDRTRLRG
jgi:CRP/FNR family transcriptional regulator, cyclic AMP receptor protein